MKYSDFNDFELLSYIGECNEEASEILYQKYQPLIISIATKIYNKINNKVGLELSDLIQEGMLGLSFAIRKYDQNGKALFYTYAKTCIERKIISAIVGASRLKHRILNESISFNVETARREQSEIDSVLSDNRMNPESLLIMNEEEQELERKINTNLDEQEIQILELKMNNLTYNEIANILGISKKQVDNKLRRIRSKLKEK